MTITIAYGDVHSPIPNGIRSGKAEGGTTTRFIVDENRDYALVLQEITNGTITTSYSYGHDLISQGKNGGDLVLSLRWAGQYAGVK